MLRDMAMRAAADVAAFVGESSYRLLDRATWWRRRYWFLRRMRALVESQRVGADTWTIAVGPVEFHCEMARQQGWSEIEIDLAWGAIADLTLLVQQLVRFRRRVAASVGLER